MRKFEAPNMKIQKLENEDFIRTSSCYQSHDCEGCYCGIVICNSGYDCTSLICPVYRH